MTTPEELCAQLKPAREAQNRTLSELARESGLPVEYLEALENGHLDRMPDPAYARIYFVNYARALRLDVEEMMLFWPAPSSGGQPAVRRPSSVRSGAMWRAPVLAVLIAGAAWLVYAWVRGAGPEYRETLESESREPIGYNGPVDTLGDTTDIPDSSASASGQQAGAPEGLARLAAAIPEERSGTGVHTLEVQASAQMWVVIEADGDTVEAGLLAASGSFQAEARRHFDLTAARPSELKAWLDGAPLDLSGHEPHALVRHRIECEGGSQP